MKFRSRIRNVMRAMLQSESEKRSAIPSITPEEVTEIKQFFPREKFFILGHARSKRGSNAGQALPGR